MMMKKCLALALVLALMLACAPALGDDGLGTTEKNGVGYYVGAVLTNLTHNCPNTGKMLPETFSPFQTTYILTVASWVSNVYLTPYCADANAMITVNGQYVRSGAQSKVITMTDNPQMVSVVVNGSDGSSTTYTVFVQRRPSERRTRSSAGYIRSIKRNSNGTWHIKADLVTLKYTKLTNLSSFTNESSYQYPYNTSANCIFYYGDIYSPNRAVDGYDFEANYDPYGMYRIIYIEDEIVAVMPYSADY